MPHSVVPGLQENSGGRPSRRGVDRVTPQRKSLGVMPSTTPSPSKSSGRRHGTSHAGALESISTRDRSLMPGVVGSGSTGRPGDAEALVRWSFRGSRRDALLSLPECRSERTPRPNDITTRPDPGEATSVRPDRCDRVRVLAGKSMRLPPGLRWPAGFA